MRIGDTGRRAIGPASLLLAGAAFAAGGHHSVDDAALLDEGKCQLETWWDRENGHARSLLHVGPNCRVGAVELSLSVDRQRVAGEGTTSTAGAQLKWAQEIDGGWSAGVVVGLAAQDRAPRGASGLLVVPITWAATPTLRAHANLGRDFRRGERDTNRAGLALEGGPFHGWSVVGERFREGGSNFWRAGARWSATPAIDVDLSRARALGHGAAAWWTLGLSWTFDR